MKKLITIIIIACTVQIQAQNLITDSTSLDREVKEVYLVELFKAAKITSFSQEKLDTNNLFVKKINIAFVDTTFFFMATIYSAPCTVDQYLFNTCEGVLIILDDGGTGGVIDSTALNQSPDLKKVIDDIVNKK